jgi:phosphoesterase RecJ-like protein
VFDVIDALGDKKMINKSIGDCIYTGIVTDTGSFRFGSTTKNTHYVAAHLLETGVKPDEIYTQVFDTNPIQKIQLLGFVLAEKLNQLNESQAAYISLSLDEQNRYSFEKGDDEGFVNYGLAIKGVKLAGYFREGQDEVKVSLRSKGDFDVNVLAREHFNGGGHRNAAGGSLKMSLEQAIVHFNKVVRLHEDALKIK